MGVDGLAMLFASIVTMAATLGVGYLASVAWVLAVAARTGAGSPNGALEIGAIVVPGVCLLPDGALPKDFRCRLARAARILADCPGVRAVILVGGPTGGPGRPSEASAGREWLVARGVPAETIRCEEASRNSLENLRALRDLLEPEADIPAIVSNRYHLARLGVLARGLGLPIRLIAAEERFTPSPAFLARALGEAFFLHWYWTGRTLARALGHRGMLARIS